jgi:hypothetical protein
MHHVRPPLRIHHGHANKQTNEVENRVLIHVRPAAVAVAIAAQLHHRLGRGTFISALTNGCGGALARAQRQQDSFLFVIRRRRSAELERTLLPRSPIRVRLFRALLRPLVVARVARSSAKTRPYFIRSAPYGDSGCSCQRFMTTGLEGGEVDGLRRAAHSAHTLQVLSKMQTVLRL